MGLVEDALGGLGAAGGAIGGAVSSEQFLPLLLSQALGQGLGVLGAQGAQEGQERLQDSRNEVQIQLQGLRDSAELERLEEKLEAENLLARLQQLAANARGSQTNRARVAQSLINAAVQGGNAESQALTRAGQLAQNFR